MNELSTEFKYDLVDQSTAEFLKQKEFNMREIVGKAYTKLGRELKEAQEKLTGVNQYNGLFEKWLKAIGFKKMTAYNLIHRFELVVQNLDDQTVSFDCDKLSRTLGGSFRLIIGAG
ncbi:hypothetical protein [Bacillus subtilis]|uniref:hypothetical protein n=1 Tax=Bacillus subtilis TaxID=1423 RepID=UPI002DBC7F71|nr:hypothetical protein [Bacillus subtilis]MEC3664075.1 hypothetical protein [Bacillus subtilis]